jgi:hypothetical protein
MRGRARTAGLNAVRGALFGANDNGRGANDNIGNRSRARGQGGRTSGS